MMLAGFLFLLLLTVLDDRGEYCYGESSNGSCSYRDVLKHLKKKDKELFSVTRPVSHHKTPTEVTLDVLLYAILDVKEKEQEFVSYVWIDMEWRSEPISWDPDEFCGINTICLPTKLLWKPDITIEEMTVKDKAPESPYLIVSSGGGVFLRNDMVVVSTCRMHVYKFPFDIQSCNLSFKSVIHSVEEIQLAQFANSSSTTEWSREMMRTQSEWLFIDMIISNKTINNFGINQSMIVYTINMKRRSLLYIVNFMLPILLFLCLDLASFLISDSGGEKLSFKVTVLLAVTVMQLILNEILPSSSDKIPLIAVYCVGSFGLMMLSLLETILVMYLMEKDSASQDNKADKDQSLSEDCGDKQGKVSFHNCFRDVNKLIHCACVCDLSPGEKSSELLPVEKEGSSSQLMEESHDSSEKLSDEPKEVVKTPALLLSSRKEEGKPGYWTRMTKTINKVFFIFYIIAASVFLVSMFFSWNTAEE